MSTTIFFLAILLFSVVIHEVSHGAVANMLGDPTAKQAGRLTLNPIKHLDPVGSIIVPILLLVVTMGRGPVLGWAKPVPINPYNFRNPKWDNAKVAMAGPGSNLLVALFFGLLMRFVPLPASLAVAFSIIVILNLALAIFNLVPIPPLDGSHLLFALLPDSAGNIKLVLHQYGTLVLLFFIFFGLRWLFVLAILAYQLIVGGVPGVF